MLDTDPRKCFFVFKTSWNHLHCNDFLSYKTSSNVFVRNLEDALNTSWWHLGRQKIITLKWFSRLLQDMSWRRLQDVLGTSKYLLGRKLIFNKMVNLKIEPLLNYNNISIKQVFWWRTITTCTFSLVYISSSLGDTREDKFSKNLQTIVFLQQENKY